MTLISHGILKVDSLIPNAGLWKTFQLPMSCLGWEGWIRREVGKSYFNMPPLEFCIPLKCLRFPLLFCHVSSIVYLVRSLTKKSVMPATYLLLHVWIVYFMSIFICKPVLEFLGGGKGIRSSQNWKSWGNSWLKSEGWWCHVTPVIGVFCQTGPSKAFMSAVMWVSVVFLPSPLSCPD